MSELTLTTKTLFNRDDVRKKFEEMLGKRATQFITSVLQIASQNELLQKADPMSIYNAASVAATLDLPLNNNLGFAYIVPFNTKQKDGSYKTMAQFQLGYKGFIQLAQRSGQFKTIGVTPIYEGQITEMNPLTGFRFDFSVKSDKVIGYASNFTLINGFEKTLYMSIEDVKKHANKYSQTFKKGFGLWKDDFDAMASKTVLKLLLSKYAPLSVEMQKAVITDQSVIDENQEPSYVDVMDITVNKEDERIKALIEDSTNPKELNEALEGVYLSPELNEMYNAKVNELNGSK